MTSDNCLAANWTRPPSESERFDLVLIDGLPEYEQVLRDIDNALKCLMPNGIFVIHSCMPCEERQYPVLCPQPLGFWTGDVWKAALFLRKQLAIDRVVGWFARGLGMVRPRPNSRDPGLLA